MLPVVSVTVPGHGTSTYKDLEAMSTPQKGDRLMLSISTHRNGSEFFDFVEVVVTRITHVPHPDYPRVWIKTRNLSFFERIFA